MPSYVGLDHFPGLPSLCVSFSFSFLLAGQLTLDRKSGLCSKFPGKTELDIKTVMVDEKLSLGKISLDWNEELKSGKFNYICQGPSGNKSRPREV